MQTQLRNLLPDREPACLDIVDVWQHNTAQGNHADVFFWCGIVLGPSDLLQCGIDILEGPRYECDETLRIFRLFTLYLSDLLQM